MTQNKIPQRIHDAPNKSDFETKAQHAEVVRKFVYVYIFSPQAEFLIVAEVMSVEPTTQEQTGPS